MAGVTGQQRLEDAYFSMATEPAFTFVGVPWCPTLDFAYVFSSPEPKAQVSFSDRLLSVRLIQKYFVRTVRTKVVDNHKPYSPIWSFRGQPFKLRGERGQNYFLNISKTKKNLLSIIEAKMLVLTFCISWYQQNENGWRNKGSQGTESLKFWCFYLLKEKHFVKRYITWNAWNMILNNMPSSNFV